MRQAYSTLFSPVRVQLSASPGVFAEEQRSLYLDRTHTPGNEQKGGCVNISGALDEVSFVFRAFCCSPADSGVRGSS